MMNKFRLPNEKTHSPQANGKGVFCTLLRGKRSRSESFPHFGRATSEEKGVPSSPLPSPFLFFLLSPQFPCAQNAGALAEQAIKTNPIFSHLDLIPDRTR